MIKLLELEFSRRWQTNKIESDRSSSPRHSSSRQFRSPRMNQNEILQVTCHCYLLLEDHQLFIVTVKAICINQGISGMMT